MVLCLCAPRAVDAAEQARQMLAGASFAWDAWYRETQAAAVGPLLYRATRGKGILPAAIEAKLSLAYLDSLRQNTRRFHELEGILRALAGAGVPVLLLKGAALAETVYGDVALRPMLDLDLLVHLEHLALALATLEGLGFVRAEDELRPGVTGAYEGEVMLEKRGAAAGRVELHWSLLNLPYYQQRMPLQPFWDSARQIAVGRTQALALSPERQLLHLCAHLALHHGREGGVLWLNDIAELLHQCGSRLDWEEVLREAQEYEVVLPLQQVLDRLAADWYVSLPGDMPARLQALRPSRAEGRALARSVAGRRPPAQSMWATLGELAGLKERLNFIVANMCPSADYMRARYHITRRALLPLYYPFRWLDGMRQSLIGLRRSLRRGTSGRKRAT